MDRVHPQAPASSGPIRRSPPWPTICESYPDSTTTVGPASSRAETTATRETPSTQLRTRAELSRRLRRRSTPGSTGQPAPMRATPGCGAWTAPLYRGQLERPHVQLRRCSPPTKPRSGPRVQAGHGRSRRSDIRTRSREWTTNPHNRPFGKRARGERLTPARSRPDRTAWNSSQHP